MLYTSGSRMVEACITEWMEPRPALLPPPTSRLCQALEQMVGRRSPSCPRALELQLPAPLLSVNPEGKELRSFGDAAMCIPALCQSGDWLGEEAHEAQDIFRPLVAACAPFLCRSAAEGTQTAAMEELWSSRA